MKKIIIKLISPSLALLVLLSTTSWTVDKHLCMGRVMDIAFFHHADSCGMEEAMAVMGEKLEGKHCCDDESFTIEGQDELQFSWYQLDLDTQTLFVAFTKFHLEELTLPMGQNLPETIYPPPLLVQDLTILHEVFLI